MFDERMINILESIKVPNTYWAKRSKEYKYWFRSLLQKMDSALVFRGLPDNWSQDFFLLCLWYFGYVVVFQSERFGDPQANNTCFQPGTLSGFDFYYQPTKALVTNPLYQKELDVHKNCEILKLTPDFMGVWDIVDHYATQLAEATKGINVGLINSKMPLVLTASNSAQAETLKKVYDKVQAGESLVVWKDITDQFSEVIPRKDPFEVWNQDYKQTYIVSNLLADLQTILDSFYMEIGLPVTMVDKKSHMLNAEADFQESQSQARISCWVNTLTESFMRINETFGLDLAVEISEANDWEDMRPTDDLKAQTRPTNTWGRDNR